MANKSKTQKEAKKPSTKDVSVSSKKTDATKPAKEEKGKAGCGTVVRSCNCTSDFQDKMYGRGMRVMNVGGSSTAPRYSCTVCGK